MFQLSPLRAPWPDINTSLSKTVEYIRLLEIQRTGDENLVPNIQGAFRVVTYPLSTTPPYECVSYAWITKEQNTPLELASGEIIMTTPSLKVALPYLIRALTSSDRTNTPAQHLWIDQLCINQTDIPERNAQVAMMADIYRKARRLLVWLGEETPALASLLNQPVRAHPPGPSCWDLEHP